MESTIESGASGFIFNMALIGLGNDVLSMILSSEYF
jgi:hypothetical protein